MAISNRDIHSRGRGKLGSLSWLLFPWMLGSDNFYHALLCEEIKQTFHWTQPLNTYIHNISFN